MHNGKYHTDEYKAKQQAKVDRLYGPVKVHIKECERCGGDYEYEGRQYTKAFERSRFCGRSCANSRQDYWIENATRYRTICFHHWPKECQICGHDKIVAVHHIDENKKNNSPENLIPLCPTHHEMCHSMWRGEVQPLIEEAVEKKFGAIG